MNVLQILPELNIGGVETGTLDLAKYLVKLGNKAVVVSNGGELVPKLKEYGIIHYSLPVHRKSIFHILKMVPKLEEIIKKEKIDIVHARSRVPAWIAYFACRVTRTVFVTTCHGYYKKHPFSYVMGWAKRVIVPSNVIARRMIDDFNVPYDRIKLIPRSVDMERFEYLSPDKKRRDDFNVGIIGRLTPLKGHLHFIKAMAKVYRVTPKIKIWIVGDAPKSKDNYKEQVRVLVRRLGLAHCTEFLGVQHDIPAIMKQLDLLVLATTAQEAFGRVIVEAQAAGVPVVATSVGGVIDIIEDNKTGLLVPAADPQAMAGAIIKILEDKELARSLAENAYRRVKEKYNVELMVKNTLLLYQEALQSFNILIIKLSALGDVILTTAALRAIRNKFPVDKYKITFLVGEESKDLLLRCPYIDELLVCNLKGKDKGLKGLIGLGRNLRQKNFDLAIDLQNNRKSHILSRLSLALDRYGYDNKKYSFLLNRRIKNDTVALGPLEHQFRILGMLGIKLEDPHLELWPSQEDNSYIDDLLKSEWLSPGQKIIGVNIGASRRWETKVWPIESIVKLCSELGRRDLRVIITGLDSDLPYITSLINSIKDNKPINACGKTSVNQLACLIKKCSVYICGDSAPLHIAAAVKTPFVALFGPTDPKRHLPPAEEYVLIRKDFSCSPCYKPKCKNKKCMESISVQEVVEAVDKLLK